LKVHSALILSFFRNDIRNTPPTSWSIEVRRRKGGLRRGQYKNIKTLQVKCPIDLEELAHEKNCNSEGAALDKYKYKNKVNTASLPVTLLTKAALLYFRLGHSLSVASFSSCRAQKKFFHDVHIQVYIEPPQIRILIFLSRIGRDIPATGDESCGHGLIERIFPISTITSQRLISALCPDPLGSRRFAVTHPDVDATQQVAHAIIPHVWNPHCSTTVSLMVYDLIVPVKHKFCSAPRGRSYPYQLSTGPLFPHPPQKNGSLHTQPPQTLA
jgi:hypothetical protein